jgi:NADPH:quinone reductase-like Zn-dependent oxidoreductase
VAQERASGREHPLADGRLPVGPAGWVDLADDDVDHAVQQLVLVGHVLVQRHRDNPQKVLIIGASGGVGTFAVQLARWLGAEVTGVCSTRNLDMVRSIGADHVIDYTREDVTRSGQRYDLLFQLAGTRSSWDCRRALTHRGTLIPSSGESDGRWIGPLDRLVRAMVLFPFVSQRLALFEAKQSGDDLRLLQELIEAGKIAPVIDRTYQLSETPEAVRYLETGHTRGKVVISV